MSEDGDNSTPDIVDFAILEAAKENVQPLAAGRRVTALSSILATPHAQRQSQLASSRNRLRINIEVALDGEDEDDDALEAYCQMVYWTLENYPEGDSAESGLIELLEEATRKLKDNRNGAWKQDMRYLKLWILYASFVEKAAMIYRFLLANEIGTDMALLYEEYSAVLERDKRRKEADEIYALGIARRAEPLDHLKSRYAEFQKRAMFTTDSSIPPPFQTPAASATPAPRRPALGSNAAPGPSTALPSTSRAPQPNAPMPVFFDPTGDASRSPDFQTNPWSDIGTTKSRVKENVPQPKKMLGSKVKQAGKTKRLASNPSSGIVPFRDEEPVPQSPRFTPFVDETSTVASPAMPSTDSGTTLRSAPASTEADALKKDPLKNYGPTILHGLY